MIRSVRWRVAVSTTLGVLLVGGGSAVAWYSSAAKILSADLDDDLGTKVKTLATLTRCVEGGVELEFSDELMPDFLPSSKASLFQIWLGDGTVIERSRSLGQQSLTLPSLPSDRVVSWDLELPDGRRGRAAALSFTVTEGASDLRKDDAADTQPPGKLPVASIMVAKSRVALDQSLAALRVSVAVVGLGLAALLTLVVTVLVGVGLRPLKRLSREVGTLDPQSGPGKMQLVGLPSELVPIGQCIDDLLSRMQAALDRERRVAANMAHELRTPVSELQSLTEVAIRWPKDEQHLRCSLTAAHAIARKMNDLTQAVLRLSQPEDARVAIEWETFDLGALIGELLAVGDGETAIQADVSAGAIVTSDRVALRMVLSNLFDNAREHSSDGPVVCRLDDSDGALEFRISNPAEGMRQEELALLGERFWRGDTTRTSTGRAHFGLGLPIAFDLCSRIGAQLSFHLEFGRLEACLSVPRAVLVPDSR